MTLVLENHFGGTVEEISGALRSLRITVRGFSFSTDLVVVARVARDCHADAAHPTVAIRT